MSTYAEALLDFYAVEVQGEAVYSALHGAAKTDAERLRWATLLQLETETKAWLRAAMLARGVSVVEDPAERAKGLGAAEQVAPLPWTVQMQALKGALEGDFIPRYQGHADAARARGAREEEALCLYMVEHERAQVEFATRELAGSPHSLEPIEKFLRYPLRR